MPDSRDRREGTSIRAIGEAYGKVLRNRSLTRLLLGEFVSSIGDWLALVALLIILYEQTEDAVVLGVLGAARVLPYVFLSIPAGILADRVDRRMILLVTDLGRGLMMLVLAAIAATGADVAAIVAVATVSTCLSAFFGPAIGSYLPALVQDESDLGPANSTYAALDNVAFIIGPAVASLILISLGLEVAFLLNAASFAFVAAILWTLPSSRGGEPLAPPTAESAGSDDPDERSIATSVHARTLVRPLGALMTIDLVESFVFGGVGILTVVIAFDLLGAGEEGTGALNSAVGAGGLLGTLLAGALVLRRRLAPPLLLGVLVLGASVAVLGWATSLPISMLAMAGAALGSVLLGVVGETLFQRVVPDVMRGRAIGVLETFTVLVFAAGSFAIPAAVEWAGLGAVLTAGGVAMVLAGVVAIPLLGDWATQTPAADPVRGIIGRVPMFASLPTARLEVAERRAAVVHATAGEVVIRQGAAADRYYVIAEGRVAVTQQTPGSQEEHHLRDMGAGEGFGEIGLLTDVPRTATVTAIEPCTFATLDRSAFLDLVGGADLTFPMLDLHRGALSSAQRRTVAASTGSAGRAAG